MALFAEAYDRLQSRARLGASSLYGVAARGLVELGSKARRGS